MNRCLNLLFIAFVAQQLMACAGQYQLPEGTQKQGTAALTLHHRMNVYPSSTTLNIFADAACEKTAGFGRVAKLGTENSLSAKPVTVTLAAGEKLFLAAYLWKESGTSSSGYRKYECTDVVAFTPRGEAKYVIKPRPIKGGGCAINLVQESSQLPPLDIEHFTAVEACENGGLLGLGKSSNF